MTKRKCCGCKERFPAESMTKHPCGWFHSFECSMQYARANRDKARAKMAAKAKSDAAAKVKAERADLRRRKEALKSRSDWMREAQTEFNKWVRLNNILWFIVRGEQVVCISCKKPPKKMNAGHYRSVGGNPELRFEPLNNHLQCEYCNTYLSGNLIDYRINLIKKIGLDKVEWLEGPHEPKKYTIDDIKEIKSRYSAMAKKCQAEINQLSLTEGC